MFSRRENRLWIIFMAAVLTLMMCNICNAAKAGDLALSRALARANIFAELTDKERDALKSSAKLRRGKSGEYLTKKGSAINKIFIVLDGRAEVLSDGKLVATMSGQFMVGENEFLVNLPVLADVILLKETDLIELDNVKLASLMESKPRIGFVLMREIARIEGQRLRETSIASGVNTDEDMAAIEKVRLSFNSAYNNGNAGAIAELVERDAIWMPHGEAVIRGQNNIRSRYAKFFSNFSSKFEFKTADIQLFGECAFLSGEWSRIDTPKRKGKERDVSGHYLMVLKKQPHGPWKIVCDMWNEIAKPLSMMPVKPEQGGTGRAIPIR